MNDMTNAVDVKDLGPMTDEELLLNNDVDEMIAVMKEDLNRILRKEAELRVKKDLFWATVRKRLSYYNHNDNRRLSINEETKHIEESNIPNGGMSDMLRKLLGGAI